ncbi:MAG: prolipoprotein diacylglyceryl transferase [Pseudomonadales bacterium]|jgi:phosphatidylglycerol:prolipoprotein diacylglycerol transferase|nr:prolipoprotein diacylglyceryl transferase [Pseudomonadales bacterium]
MLRSINVFGLFDFPVITIFLFLAVFFGAFAFWRKLRNEGAYDEMETFDGFLLSLLFGFAVGRLVFILTHFDNFGLNLLAWVNIISHPGLNLLAAIAGSGFFLFRFVKKRKEDAFAVIDFWAIATSLGLAFYEIGQFFEGSNVGNLTNMPWGMTFPGMLLPAHPAAIYSAIFFFILFFYLNWAEFHYRTFDWYRRGRSSAQAGFITGFFLMANGIFMLFALLWRPANFAIEGITIDGFLYIILAVIGFGFIYLRSGRKLFKRSGSKNVVADAANKKAK